MNGTNDYNSSATGSVPNEPGNTSAYGAAQNAGTMPQQPYGTAYPPPGYVPPVPGTPNPGLALLLGFIPGVGAMYNGQFAKGLAHIVIFAVLTSLTDHVNGIFGLLVAGWVFYMVFDAYQTARARREGLVVPDPFGLNNIGERFGLGRGPNWNDFVARPAGGAASAAAQTSAPPYEPVPEPASYPPQETPYGTPASGAAYQAAAGPYASAPYGVPQADAVPPYGTAYPGTPYAGSPYAAPVPPLSPLAARSGMPSGALWLIGLGLFALLGSIGHTTFYFGGRFFAGTLLIVIGVALIVNQLRKSRGVYPEHSAAANWYAVNSSRGGVFLVAIGIFMLLDAARIATWHYTWPYLLILLGIYQIASRTAYNRMLEATSPLYPAGGAPESTVYTPAAPVSTSMVPHISRDQEGQ